MATAYEIAMKQAEPEQVGSAPVIVVEDLRKTFGITMFSMGSISV